MAQVLIEESDLKAIGDAHASMTALLAKIQVKVPTGPAIKLPGAVTREVFRFGNNSSANLQGVDSRLVQCTKRAIQITRQDFGVFEGLRTVERQRYLVDTRKSRTMASKHLEGLALDLVPWMAGKFVWDWGGCAKIAFAMDQAATQLGIAHLITWGGAWDRKLSDYGGILAHYMDEVQKYKARHEGSDFIDGPHFQIEGPKQ